MRQVQIVRFASVEGSPRPLVPNELLTVSDATAEEWIGAGIARAFGPVRPQPQPVAPVVRSTRREKAVRV